MRHSRCALVLLAVLATMLGIPGCGHLVILHDPLTAREHGDLGVAYETHGQLDLAEKEYHRSLSLDPHQSRTRVNLGNVQAAKGEWRSAEESYRRALADSVTNTDAMNNLAVALLRQGRKPDEARALAERAVAMASSDSTYRATLAEVEASARRDPAKSKQGP